MDNNSAKCLEEILTLLPACIYKKRKNVPQMFFLRIGALCGGGWFAYYKSAYGKKAFPYGDVTSNNLRDCLVKCLNEIELLKEKKDDDISFIYDDIM